MKTILIASLAFMVGLSITFFIDDVAAWIGEVPPTNAWRTINVNDNTTITTSSDTSVSALNYRDNLWIVSDGSINIEIGSYP